jgi:hypothetical protein
LRCSWRMESMLVLGAVALSDIQSPRIQIVSPQCILLRWEEIVCCPQVGRKPLTAEIAEQTQELAEKTESQVTARDTRWMLRSLR